MGINFKEVFGEVLDTTLAILSDAAASYLKSTTQAREYIAEEKIKTAKDVLWVAFPFIITGGIVLAIVKWKS